MLILLGGIVSGIVGFGMGYLTLRLRGAFFAIATLALAVVLQTLIINWALSSAARAAPMSSVRRRSTCSGSPALHAVPVRR